MRPDLTADALGPSIVSLNTNKSSSSSSSSRRRGRRRGASGGVCVCVLLLQDLLQSCSRFGRRRVCEASMAGPCHGFTCFSLVCLGDASKWRRDAASCSRLPCQRRSGSPRQCFSHPCGRLARQHSLPRRYPRPASRAEFLWRPTPPV